MSNSSEGLFGGIISSKHLFFSVNRVFGAVAGGLVRDREATRL